MKIRDLQQYIKLICGEVPTQIGNSSDRLLTQLRGERTSLDFVKSTTTFASETYIQIFYEFLQNANDAQASQIYFCFDKENLLVINNGKPFYTEKPAKAKGQLRRFLTEKDTDKDPQDIGKYGMGSKLLYDFFLDVHNDSEKSEQIYEILVDKHKAPILFSWSKPTDLEFDDIDNFVPKDCQDIDYPLLTRIIYTYYPAMPNEERTDYLGNKVNLFPQAEQNKFFAFFKHCIEEYNISKSALTTGTALYITLGKGQAELLQEELDKGKIIEDIQEELDKVSIIENIRMSLFFLKNTNRVQINAEVINHKKVEEQFFIENLPTGKLPLHKAKEGEKVSVKIPTLQLLFPKKPQYLNKKKVSNFFLYFPILNLQLGYKFIINSNTFSTKPDRQDIAISENEQHNRKTIKIIGIELNSYVKKLRENKQQDKHIAFFKCLLDSKKTKEGYDFYEEHIYNNLYKAFSENIPTATGFRDSAEYVKIKNTSLSVNPKDLGLEDYDWLHPDLEDYQEQVQEIFDEIEKWNIIDLLNQAEYDNYDNIVNWLKTLTQKNYQRLLSELVSHTSNPNSIKDIPFIKFENNEFRSLSEILEIGEPYFLVTEKTKGIKEILRSKCKVKTNLTPILASENKLFQNIIAEFDDDKALFDRTNYHLLKEEARQKLNHRDKWDIFRNFHEKFDNAKVKNKIAKELIIFQNKKGDYKPLYELHPAINKSATSLIFNHYQMKYSEIEVDDFSQIYQYTLQDKPNELWQLFYENYEEIHLAEIKNKTEHLKLIYQDLHNLYEKTNKRKSIEDLNFVYTTTKEFAKPTEILYHTALKDFSQNDYQKLTTFLAKNTNYQFIPFEHLQYFEDYLSSYASPTSYREIKDDFTTDEFVSIEKIELLLLKKLKSPNEQFFVHFVLKRDNKTLKIKVKEKYDYQYFLEDSYRELNQFLEGSSYYRLPANLLDDFATDTVLLKESDEFANQLIDDYENEPALMELVYHTTPNVKRKYINKVLQSGFNLYSEGEKYSKKSFEARFIEIGVNLEEVDNIKNNTFIDERPLSEFEWSDNISFRVDDETYVKFSLETLLPRKANGSKILEQVKSLFPHNIPSEKLFTQKDAPLRDIKSDLLQEKESLFGNNKESLERVAFLVAYYLSDKSSQDTKPAIPVLQVKKELLEVFLKQGQKGLRKYHEYYQFEDFTPKNCLQSPDPSLLLPEEKLPNWVQTWLNTHKDKKKAQEFLKAIGVNPKSHSAITVRKALKKNESTHSTNTLIKYKAFCVQTFEWFAQTQNTSIKKTEANYHTLSNLIEGYATEHKELPNYMLYLSSKDRFEYQKRYSKTDTITINNTDYRKYLDKLSYALINKKIQSKIIISSKQIFIDNGIKEGKIEGKFLKDETQKKYNVKPLNKDYYKKWVALKDTEYRIYLSNHSFPFEYRLVYDNQIISLMKDEEGIIALQETEKYKEIYIYPEAEKYKEQSIIQILKEHENNEEENSFFKGEKQLSQFNKLLGLYIDEKDKVVKEIEDTKLEPAKIRELARYEKAIQTLKTQGFSEPSQIQALIDKQNKPHLELDKNLSNKQKKLLQNNIDELLKLTENFEQDELKKIIDKQKELKKLIKLPEEDLQEVSDKLDELVELAKKFSKDQLEEILNYADILKNLLEQEREGKTKPNSITGFIGEMLTYYYLVFEHNIEEGEGKLEYVADKKREYDITVNYKGKYYEIDTKTTIKTLSEDNNAIPLYVKLSQYRYVKHNKVKNYLIDRISLKDMGNEIIAIKNRYSKRNLEIVREALKDEIKEYMNKPDNREKYKNASFMFRINYEDFFEEDNDLKE